jgi:hypothetical protein
LFLRGSLSWASLQNLDNDSLQITVANSLQITVAISLQNLLSSTGPLLGGLLPKNGQLLQQQMRPRRGGGEL